MKRLLPLLTALFVLSGCSKEEAPPPPVEPESDEAALEESAAAAPAPAAQAQAPIPNDLVLQDLDSIPLVLENQDYETAVSSLAAMQHVQMSPEQQRAYQQQLFNTQQYLLQKAKTDAAAREAYNRLGRQATGR